MEIYPFHHRNLFFHIITDLDLSFQEVRGILDHLLDTGVWGQDEEDPGEGKLLHFRLGEVEYNLDVRGCEVIILRRTELSPPVD